MQFLERSFLFVPGDRPERFEKANSSCADGIIIDLEDAVLPEKKIIARENSIDFMSKGNKVFIRINSADTEWYKKDMNVIAHKNCVGVFLPKAENETVIYDLSIMNKPIYPIIESARGFKNIQAISQARHVRRLVFGTIDFSLDTGIENNEKVLIAVRTEIVITSRLAGLYPPVDGITTEFHKYEMTIKNAIHSRKMGFGGKLCIHPSQVSHVNKAFSYSEKEIKWATEIIQLSEYSHGAFSHEGKMVDKPILERAKIILGYHK